MTCKHCGTEMQKVFHFESENFEQLECPNCGASTKPRAIIYDDNGNLSNKPPKKRNQKKREKVSE